MSQTFPLLGIGVRAPEGQQVQERWIGPNGFRGWGPGDLVEFEKKVGHGFEALDQGPVFISNNGGIVTEDDTGWDITFSQKSLDSRIVPEESRKPGQSAHRYVSMAGPIGFPHDMTRSFTSKPLRNPKCQAPYKGKD